MAEMNISVELQMAMKSHGRQISVKIVDHGTFRACTNLCQLIRVIYVAHFPAKR